jgi:hypothetical protein
MNLSQFKVILRELIGNENTLSNNVLFIDFCGGMHGKAQFLSQLFYWQSRTKRADGFFYKTYDEWQSEIRVAKYSVMRYSKEFQSEGFLKTKVKRANGFPTVHYQMDIDKLLESLVAFCDNRKLQSATIDSDNLQLTIDSDNLQLTSNIDYHKIQTESTPEDEESSSTPPHSESPKPKDKKREPKGKTLFKTNFGGEDGFEKFCAAFEGSDYVVVMNVNLRYYYEAVRDWSASSGSMKSDWIATARSFMRGDIQKNKFVKNGTLTTTNGKGTVDVDLAKRATERFLAKRGINI